MSITLRACHDHLEAIRDIIEQESDSLAAAVAATELRRQMHALADDLRGRALHRARLYYTPQQVADAVHLSPEAVRYVVKAARLKDPSLPAPRPIHIDLSGSREIGHASVGVE